MPDPHTARSHAEYLELLEQKKEYVKKHGHRMLDTEEDPWEYIPAPQEEKDERPSHA